MSRGHACCYVQNPQSSVSTDRNHLSLDWLPLFKSTAYPGKKTFMPAVSFASLLPLGDTTVRHELLGFLGTFWDLKGSGSKPNGSTPQIANSDKYKATSSSWLIHRTKFIFTSLNLTYPPRCLVCPRYNLCRLITLQRQLQQLLQLQLQLHYITLHYLNYTTLHCN